jgi:hypothetical protein
MHEFKSRGSWLKVAAAPLVRPGGAIQITAKGGPRAGGLIR